MKDMWKDMFREGMFHCSICKKIPVTPVWFSLKGQNVCNNCYEANTDNFQFATKNLVFNRILEKLSFPCGNSNNGCGRVVEYLNYHKHVSECLHTQTCLFAGCHWGGTRQQLIMHLCDHHPQSIIRGGDGVFPLASVEDVPDTIGVLHTKVGRFVIRFKIDLEKLRIVIYGNDNFELGLEQFVVQFQTGPTSTVQFQCTVNDDLHSLSTFDSNYTTEVNLEEKQCTASIQLIYKPKTNRPTIPRQLIPYFKCKDCDTYTITKWVCNSGHLVCYPCSSHGHECTDRKRLNQNALTQIIDDEIKCSHCRTSLGGFWERNGNDYMCNSCEDRYGGCKNVRVQARPVPVDLAGEFEFPCLFEVGGCQFLGPIPRDHEDTCDYRKLNCPISNCNNINHYSKLLLHFSDTHRNVCVVQNTHQLILNLKVVNMKEKYFLMCYNLLFICTLEKINSGKGTSAYKWNVEEASKKYNDNYLFTIDINGAKSLLSVMNVCGKTLTLNGDVLDTFAVLDQIPYSIKITEKHR